jgi:nucleosome binding factor SPN SPT16 subunit
MNIITGSISAKDVEISFNKNDVELKSTGKPSMVIRDIHFAAFERVSSTLKTCELVLVNSDNRPVIVTIFQKFLPQITPLLQCPIINIGQDPENWSRLGSVARKNDWQKDDWMHVFSAGDTDKDDDDEWLPGSEDEGSEDEDSDEFLLENNSDSE